MDDIQALIQTYNHLSHHTQIIAYYHNPFLTQMHKRGTKKKNIFPLLNFITLHSNIFHAMKGLMKEEPISLWTTLVMSSMIHS